MSSPGLVEGERIHVRLDSAFTAATVDVPQDPTLGFMAVGSPPSLPRCTSCVQRYDWAQSGPRAARRSKVRLQRDQTGGPRVPGFRRGGRGRVSGAVCGPCLRTGPRRSGPGPEPPTGAGGPETRPVRISCVGISDGPRKDRSLSLPSRRGPPNVHLESVI